MHRPVILSTDRLELLEFHPQDAGTFYDLNLDPEVMKYTGDVAFNSEEESREFILAYEQYKRHGYGRWTVRLKANGEVIGWCGLKNHPEEGYVDLGYRFHRKYWGKGYATESARACLDLAFDHLDLKVIVGRTARENTASIRVLEKIGMTFWKEAPCEGIQDSIYFRIENPSRD